MQMQDQSIKIRKSKRISNSKECNFLCGGCQNAYRSYPALYLHIKRKHNGIKPPNTRVSKLNDSQSMQKHIGGRPQKPSQHIDDIEQKQLQIEQLQSEFLGFLGEILKIVCFLDQKPKLEEIVLKIRNYLDVINNKVSIQMKDQIQELSQDLKQNENNIDDAELDFDTFMELETSNSLKILCWFLLWLGKYTVKTEVLDDLSFVFFKIWTVLEQKDLNIQDLDNKLVWKEVTKECETNLINMKCFEGKKDLVYEFISKVCQLIGKIFE